MNQSHLLKKGIVGLSCFLIASTAFAEERQPALYDFEYSNDSIGWQQSENQSQLFRNHVQQAGRAALSYGHRRGGLRSFNEAGHEHVAEARGEAYFRLSPRTSVYGLTSFASQREVSVSGSAFLNERLHAFDLVLKDPSNTGDRKKEIYLIRAAIGHQIDRRFSIGAFFDYRGINLARTKDLRHTNKILDMTVSPSMSWKINNKLITGINYSYNRFVEGVKFSQYGTTDKQHFTLIDFGAFNGKQELFDQNGYTEKNALNPYVEQVHRIGWQVEYTPTARLSLFNEFVWGTGDGYFGKKASSSIQYTRHETGVWKERLSAVYRGDRLTQRLELEAENLNLTNYENSWRTETSSSGNSVIEYYGENRVGEKKYTGVSGVYSIEEKGDYGVPRWRISVAGEYGKRKILSILYPYYRTQDLQLYRQYIGALRSYTTGTLQWVFKGGIGFSGGNGDPYKDDVYVTPSTSEGAPVSGDHQLKQEYEYLTAKKLETEAGMRVTLPVGKVSYYASIDYRATFLPGKSDLSGSRHRIGCSLGINF